MAKRDAGWSYKIEELLAGCVAFAVQALSDRRRNVIRLGDSKGGVHGGVGDGRPRGRRAQSHVK